MASSESASASSNSNESSSPTDGQHSGSQSNGTENSEAVTPTSSDETSSQKKAGVTNVQEVSGVEAELDDFGLPIRVKRERMKAEGDCGNSSEEFHEAEEGTETKDRRLSDGQQLTELSEISGQALEATRSSSPSESHNATQPKVAVTEVNSRSEDDDNDGSKASEKSSTQISDVSTRANDNAAPTPDLPSKAPNDSDGVSGKPSLELNQEQKENDSHGTHEKRHSHVKHDSTGMAEWSHQRLNEQQSDDESDSEVDWKDMPALGELDHYDDYGRLVAKGSVLEDDDAVYSGLGGAGKGYTRVQLDEDAQSATSMDEDTSYLFNEGHGTSAGVDDDVRDLLSQLQATKELLTEGQRIAYVGVVRLAIYQMTKFLESIPPTKGSKKALRDAVDYMKAWGQGVMIRLFTHMDIDSAEQIMIEQLAEHGVQPADLVPPLMRNARVKNPMAMKSPSLNSSPRIGSPRAGDASKLNQSPAVEESSRASSPPPYEEKRSPPPYEANQDGVDGVPEVQTPSQMPTSASIDIDLRWTVLCDLFLVLISDSSYDSRSRALLEQVAQAMDISWVQISRFEKRVIDSLEMEQTAEKETWDEASNMEERRKKALKSKYVIMGLATVGGGLVIGLSAGLLAPVIGAGLAAGFTTIGISGTGAFLGGTAGTALIASGATLTGTVTGLRASNRRTGAVKTFEYRPLHNNKRVNLIVTVSGWMTGTEDDVRLPYSTVDPIMGDLYSVFWEPEMLQSMGSTINILATEALTQGLQQVLGSTILTALMGALQLPLVLSKLAYLIDNPWNVSLVRANAAGLILADSIMDRNLGKRPITLLGFSLGSRMIFSCLKELAKKGAYGLVQNVYLFGSPVVANKDEYLKARSVVSGRFVNGYCSHDWILGYLFRATSGGIMRVAGLAPILGIPGLENFDATNLVTGHMNYRAAMPRLLREVGWEVLSDEFAEIEDADPDDHAARQRELIREIDEARKEAELKPDRKRFGLFKRSRLAQKRGWETYDPQQADQVSHEAGESSHGGDNVLFDIDAIRAELASEQIEVKQLESTLPPMKLDLRAPNESSSPVSQTSRPDLKQSKSVDDAKLTTAASPHGGNVSANLSGFPNSTSSHTHDGAHDEDIQMTFDTSYHVPPKESDYGSHPYADGLSASRPPFHSAASLPVEHNAWADRDVGHGGGDEIHMTFE